MYVFHYSCRADIKVFRLVEDSLHPLQTTLPANNNCPRPTGAYPPFSEEDIRLSTEKVVKPLRALARFKARPVSRTSDGLDVLGLLRQVNEQLDAAMELEGFLRIVAGVFQELTEFSRVMVYQVRSVFFVDSVLDPC